MPIRCAGTQFCLYTLVLLLLASCEPARSSIYLPVISSALITATVEPTPLVVLSTPPATITPRQALSSGLTINLPMISISGSTAVPTPLPPTVRPQLATPAPTATLAPPPPMPPSPTPSPTPPIGVWRGEYYANRTLAGTPVLVRDDATVQFDWGYSAPGPGLPDDNFSVRWTSVVAFDAGIYRFYARSDDGVRIWVDDELLLNQWREAAVQLNSAVRSLGAGMHVVRVDYFEAEQLAQISVWWEHSGDFPDWRGEYFASGDLSGTPATIRNDPTLDFEWGYDAPAPGLPVDYFSVRWTRDLDLPEGYYRFHLLMDDGMRLFVDNNLLLSEWRIGTAREATAGLALSAGNHSIRLEYFDATGEARARLWWEQVSEPLGFPN